jgi:hypothetical protein
MLSSLPLSYLSLSVRNAKQLLFATFGCRLLPLSLLASPSGYRYFFTCDSASSMQPASNQSMKPTAPLRNNLTHSLPLIRPSARPSMSQRFPRAPFSVFATTPCVAYLCLVRRHARVGEMNIKVTSVDYAPEDVLAQTPFSAPL